MGLGSKWATRPARNQPKATLQKLVWVRNAGAGFLYVVVSSEEIP